MRSEGQENIIRDFLRPHFEEITAERALYLAFGRDNIGSSHGGVHGITRFRNLFSVNCKQKQYKIHYHERGVSAWLITSSLKTLKKSEPICVSFMCMALRAEQNMMPRVHAPMMMNAAGWRAGWETTCGSRRRRKERTFSCR